MDWTYIYEDFLTFEAHKFPRLIRMYVAKRLALEARVEELSAQTFGSTEFEPPSGAQSRSWCPETGIGRMRYGPQFRHPDRSEESFLVYEKGWAVVYGVLGSDGRLRNLNVLTAHPHDAAGVTLSMARQLSAQAVSCEGHPVELETILIQAFAEP